MGGNGTEVGFVLDSTPDSFAFGSPASLPPPSLPEVHLGGWLFR